MRVLGLITARGGSKGIPGKNVKPLGGRPLLLYTAEAALEAEELDAVIVSTDDESIADLGRGAGLSVPFIRPSRLARDDTPSLDVVRHALDEMASAGERFDAVCLLQPTSPFRPPGLIDACVSKLDRSPADSVVTVAPIPIEFHPHWAFAMDAAGRLQLMLGDSEPAVRRQDLPPAYHRDGRVYVSRTDAVLAGSLYGHACLGHLDYAPSVNLDTPDDWLRAEALLETEQG